jgi:hypothetical protein
MLFLVTIVINLCVIIIALMAMMAVICQIAKEEIND